MPLNNRLSGIFFITSKNKNKKNNLRLANKSYISGLKP